MKKNNKYEAFVASHRHWRHARPRATVRWPEDKKRLQQHLVEAARLLAKLPFVPSRAQVEQFAEDPWT